MGTYYYVITYISNIFVLRRPREIIFADITKIVATFIKTIFIESNKLKE